MDSYSIDIGEIVREIARVEVPKIARLELPNIIREELKAMETTKCQYCGDNCIHSYSEYCPNCGMKLHQDVEEADVHRCYKRYTCSGCGDFVDVGANYCEECGRKLNWKTLMGEK